MNIKLKFIAIVAATILLIISVLLGLTYTFFPSANVSVDDILLCLGGALVMFVGSWFFKNNQTQVNEENANVPKWGSVYEGLCTEFNALEEKAEQALLDLLASRGIESINMKAYADNEDIDKFYFPQTDKNGYGVNIAIDTIRKDKKRKWVADVVDEDDDDWGTLDLNRQDFPNGALLDIIGLVERIFECADEEHDGHVLAADEDFDDLKNE